MTIRVLLFASYADAVGRSELALEVPDGSVVADILAAVRGMAGATALPSAPLLAVNAIWAGADRAVQSGDEVAIIPPVAGG